jgi:hypothetical protein
MHTAGILITGVTFLVLFCAVAGCTNTVQAPNPASGFSQAGMAGTGGGSTSGTRKKT